MVPSRCQAAEFVCYTTVGIGLRIGIARPNDVQSQIMTRESSARMLAEERQGHILEYLAARRTARIHDLCMLLHLSVSTLRRDLQELERQGRIRRVHGGVVLIEDRPQLPILQRAAQFSVQKRRIGAAAAELVADGETIIVTGGSTTETMVPFLATRSSLTVITNALNVANMLSEHAHITVIILGGWLNHDEGYALGYLTELCLHDLRADKVFHGVFGLDPQRGMTSTSIQDVQTDRSIIAVARELIILADHSKLQRTGPVRLAPIEAASTIITDTEAPTASVEAFRGFGVKVIQA
jgi:DeoR/GlpR family transcriptional regulator of sugar metabolism